jgi:hypothetical protein
MSACENEFFRCIARHSTEDFRRFAGDVATVLATSTSSNGVPFPAQVKLGRLPCWSDMLPSRSGR